MALKFKFESKDEVPAEHLSIYAEGDGAVPTNVRFPMNAASTAHRNVSGRAFSRLLGLVSCQATQFRALPNEFAAVQKWEYRVTRASRRRQEHCVEAAYPPAFALLLGVGGQVRPKTTKTR